MKIMVSQGSMLIDGAPACPNCGRRPRRAIPQGTKAYAQGRRWYGYCTICGLELEQKRKKDLMRVSPEERELILELRRVQPSGRHHARLRVLPWMMNAVLWQLPLWIALVARARG